MARTRRVKAPKPKNVISEQMQLVKQLNEQTNREEKAVVAELESMKQQELEDWRMLQLMYRAKFPSSVLKRTIREIKSGAVGDSVSSIMFSTMNSTRSQRQSRSQSEARKRQTYKVNEDEGYLTAESSGGTSGEHTRGNKKATKTLRISRSLSRTAKANSYKTPVHTQAPFNCLGTITPKVKQNTPQVILRRPKQGEMALSYQGSPLLTGPVVQENAANVNIPLSDGNMLSLMPQRGLRTSQLPEVDVDVKRQLEILRDNLIKVCKDL
ncbi:borealin-like isoform X1 [Cylas formicarius]|uniref:borealin-like isoform X1 n=1 Tax=Cylas formicarius TaxID=197179 RepID=UPI002958CBB9|nr:borealin-like isoform X1 [Cylas formicarius]